MHALKGTKQTIEHIQKRVATRKKKNSYIKSEKTRKKMSLLLKGRHLSPVTQFKKGNLHYNWKGGISTINQRIRSSSEYKLWREAVFKRDNYTCRFCGQRGGILQADHIKPFSLFPELRFALDNGRTLCEDCHRQTNTWGRPKKMYYDTSTNKKFQQGAYRPH